MKTLLAATAATLMLAAPALAFDMSSFKADTPTIIAECSAQHPKPADLSGEAGRHWSVAVATCIGEMKVAAEETLALMVPQLAKGEAAQWGVMALVSACGDAHPGKVLALDMPAFRDCLRDALAQ